MTRHIEENAGRKIAKPPAIYHCMADHKAFPNTKFMRDAIKKAIVELYFVIKNKVKKTTQKTRNQGCG